LSDGIDHQALPLPTIAAASTVAVFDHFDLDGVPIVANSMGGYWSIQFSLEHPGRPSALALLGCPALFPGEELPAPARLMNLPLVGGLLVERILQPSSVDDMREGMVRHGHPETTIRSVPDKLVEAAYRMERLPHYTRSWLTLLRSITRLVGETDIALTPDDLGRVRPPVLLGWGSTDSFGGPEVGQAGAKHFRDAEFHEIGFGHLPWLDAPAAFGELVRGFLSRDK
jgi:pimeloyl-ACP methyl ester carboxylesterase